MTFLRPAFIFTNRLHNETDPRDGMECFIERVVKSKSNWLMITFADGEKSIARRDELRPVRV